MLGSLDRPPVVVRGSRRHALLIVLGSSLFVVSAVVLPADSYVLRPITILFFGMCGLVGVWLLIAPARLVIGPSGFAQTAMWRTRQFAWTDVYNFRPAGISPASKVVGFDYLGHRPKRRGIPSLNTALSGAQGSLQPGWELDAQSLAKLLNEAREKWLSQPDGAPQAAPAAPSRLAGLSGARMNRKVYWIATGAIFAVVAALSFIPVLGSDPRLMRASSAVSFLFFIRIFAARLHDFGRSGWWQLVLYVVQTSVIIVLVLVMGDQTFAGAVGLLIQAVFTVVIGVVPGNLTANRFGPPPGTVSPAAASEVFR